MLNWKRGSDLLLHQHEYLAPGITLILRSNFAICKQSNAGVCVCEENPQLVRFRSRQIGSLDESSRLPRQSPWRRYCCVGSPGPTAAASRWGPPPSPPVVEPRSSTPRLPLLLYETDNCPLSPFRFPFPPSLATAEWVVMLLFFFRWAHGAGWLQAHLEKGEEAGEKVGELSPSFLNLLRSRFRGCVVWSKFTCICLWN